MAFVTGVPAALAGSSRLAIDAASRTQPQSVAHAARRKVTAAYTYAASQTFGSRFQFDSTSSRRPARGPRRARAHRKPFSPSPAAASSDRNPFSIVCAKAETPEKFEFQAEVNRLMDLIIHSLYSNKEIFLRELISNASDALDKVRFLGTQREGLLKDGEELKIGIRADKNARTLTISDNGIGMSKQELIDNLGTIARSGTSKFIESIKEGQNDMSLIGKFGVGFYSAYLVADRATVVTKSADETQQWKWESAADGTFTVEECSSPKLERGTSIVLHIKEDQAEFLEESRLRQVIKRYSEFINFPIYLWTSSEATKTGEDGKEEKETVHEWELLNQNKPLWMRSPKEVTDEEYKEFYKGAFKDFYDPLAWTHFSAEGSVEFRSILFLPERAGFQADEDWLRKSHSMKLYVRRVFIADEFEELMPRYLNFVRGLVDSEDLPLNVSREILQQSRVLRTIRSRLVRKALDMIKEAAGKGGETYDKFWASFGRNIKLGVIEDSENQKELMESLRFFSSKSKEGVTSLADYVSRMKEGQKSIYYIAGESVAAIERAPFLERLLARDLEVLYFVDPIDELMMGHVFEYAEKPFVNVTKEGLELDGEEEEKKEEGADKEEEESMKEVVSWLENHLKGRVQKVNLSKRLEQSPAVVVTGMFGWTANMERIMKAQTMNDGSKLNGLMNQKILEINPKHSLIARLADRIKEEPEGAGTGDLADVIFETALLISGFSIDSQAEYAARVYRLLERS